MPNWCSTNIAFYGNAEIIKDFNEKLTKWTKEEPLYGSDFGSVWLGNILAHTFGIDFVDSTLNNRDLKYRGYITYVDDDLYDVIGNYGITGKKYFSVYTDTAWAPMIKMWRLIINKLYGKWADIHIAYMANEEGCELNWIWDPEHIIADSQLLYHLSVYNEDDIEQLDNIEIVDCTADVLIGLLEELFSIKCNDTKLLSDLKSVNDEIELWMEKKGFYDSSFIISAYEIIKEEP